MISLQGFTRYHIFPDGRVLDTKTNKPVIFNRHLNFAMFPDEEKLDEKGKPVYVMENIRSLIKFLVDEKTPGFTEYMPEYKAPDFFAPIYEYKRTSEDDKNAKKLHELRIELKLCTERMLRHSTEENKKAFTDAKASLDHFKDQHPHYHRWAPYADITPPDMSLVKEMRDREAEIEAEIADIKLQIKETRKRLFGVVELLGFKVEHGNHGL